MSLINDAIKRAKQAQNQSSPADDPPPAFELAPRPATGAGWAVPLLLAAVLALAGIFLWRWVDGRRRAADVPALATVSQPVAKPASETVTPVAATVSAPVATNPPAVVVAVPATAIIPTATNLAVAPVPVKPAPPIYKLQSIFFGSANPCVVINGKILYVGDHVGDARVVSIHKDSAVIVTTGGQTNQLDIAL